MIYTVTFNPAWDYVVFLENLIPGEINRAKHETIVFGGKGINVSGILKELGVKSTAMGFVAGFTGEALEAGLQALGIHTDFIHLPEGNTRINVKIKHGTETELNGQGPVITPKALKELYAKLDRLEQGDTLVLAGSIPDTLPADTYERILERLQGKGVRTVVDASDELLLNVVKYHPFLIKPNHLELGEMFHTQCMTGEEIAHYAGELQKLGAENVLVSMAGDGAILLTASGEQYRIASPGGVVVNSVGAGDSMVAGFLAGYDKNKDYLEALKLGTAAGSATAFTEGLADEESIRRLYETLKIS